jgi:hypothetical protein
MASANHGKEKGMYHFRYIPPFIFKILSFEQPEIVEARAKGSPVS